MAHGHHVEVVAIGIAHMECVDFELGEVPGHIIEIDGKSVLAFSGGPRRGRCISSTIRAFGFYIKRPKLFIVDVGVWAGSIWESWLIPWRYGSQMAFLPLVLDR
jgi:hypothetical protein